MVNSSPPVLAADLNAGLKRLKMAAMRRLAPELLITAKTQRWSPEEFLRTLVEAEIAARDASNAATRRRQAGFPVTKTLDGYDLTASSVPQATGQLAFVGDFGELVDQPPSMARRPLRTSRPAPARPMPTPRLCRGLVRGGGAAGQQSSAARLTTSA